MASLSQGDRVLQRGLCDRISPQCRVTETAEIVPRSGTARRSLCVLYHCSALSFHKAL